MLLAVGKQAWDRWHEISSRLSAEGIVLPGRYKYTSRLNPLVPAEVAARDAVIRILKHLDLPPAGPS
jgi:hypothetical protein